MAAPRPLCGFPNKRGLGTCTRVATKDDGHCYQHCHASLKKGNKAQVEEAYKAMFHDKMDDMMHEFSRMMVESERRTQSLLTKTIQELEKTVATLIAENIQLSHTILTLSKTTAQESSTPPTLSQRVILSSPEKEEKLSPKEQEILNSFSEFMKPMIKKTLHPPIPEEKKVSNKLTEKQRAFLEESDESDESDEDSDEEAFDEFMMRTEKEKEQNSLPLPVVEEKRIGSFEDSPLYSPSDSYEEKVQKWKAHHERDYEEIVIDLPEDIDSFVPESVDLRRSIIKNQDYSRLEQRFHRENVRRGDSNKQTFSELFIHALLFSVERRRTLFPSIYWDCYPPLSDEFIKMAEREREEAEKEKEKKKEPTDEEIDRNFAQMMEHCGRCKTAKIGPEQSWCSPCEYAMFGCRALTKAGNQCTNLTRKGKYCGKHIHYQPPKPKTG